MKFVLGLAVLLSSASVFALEIPGNLSETDQKQLTHILGPTSGIKTLTQPFPLGGYDGFEIGLSLETIDISNMDNLGSGTTGESKDTLTIPKLTFSKGLYFDFDVFFEFSPLLRQEKVSEFGLLFRRSLYESGFYPINVSFNFYGSAVNVDNIFTSETYGYDLVTGLTLSNMSFYLGVGSAATSSTIIGNKQGTAITDTGNNESLSLEQFHSMVGFSYNVGQMYMAFQADRYRVPVYSFKFGYRL